MRLAKQIPRCHLHGHCDELVVPAERGLNILEHSTVIGEPGARAVPAVVTAIPSDLLGAEGGDLGLDDVSAVQGELPLAPLRAHEDID